MPGLTVSMIVKNEEKKLKKCLDSIKDAADEIVIVDTGSTDDTIKIAEEYKARIFHFGWQNDFSAARNYALSKSTCSWILYIDADEVLPSSSLQELKTLIGKDEAAGFKCTVKSIDSQHGRNNSMQYVRLFKYTEGIKFQGKVHEQIVHSLVEKGYTIRESGIEIIHTGYDIAKDEKQKKALRNLPLLLDEYYASKSSYYAFQLGLTYQILQDNDRSKFYFEEAVKDELLKSSYRAHAYSASALILLKDHKLCEAEKNIRESLKLNCRDSFTNLLASKLYLRKKEIKKAKQFFKDAVRFNNKSTHENINSDLSITLNDSELIQHEIMLLREENNNSESEALYERYISLITRQHNEGAKNCLVKFIRNEESDDSEIAELLIASDKLLEEILFVLDLPGSITTKIKILKALYAKNNSEKIKIAFANVLLENNDIVSAVNLYEELAEDNCSDPSIYFQLISANLTQGKLTEIKPIINIIENRFAFIPEVKTSAAYLRSKLQSILSK